jgi:hypothetical protein
MQVCLPKHNYKLDNNLLTVEPRAVDPHCFDADPDPDPDGGGGGRSAKNVHPPLAKPWPLLLTTVGTRAANSTPTV